MMGSHWSETSWTLNSKNLIVRWGGSEILILLQVKLSGSSMTCTMVHDTLGGNNAKLKISLVRQK